MLSAVGLFKNIKQGLAASMTPPTPEQMAEILAQLPPDKRAELEANMALAEQASAGAQAVFEQERAHRIAGRVLDGPAGEKLYGRAEDLEGPQDVARRMQEEGAGSVYKGMLGDTVAGLREGMGELLSGGKVDEVTDPEARARVSAEHRAARDTARAPYLAGAVPAVTISRLTTRGGTQVEEVAAYLEHSGLADHPERVYGVYRVPDRISPTLTTNSERGRVVEWDVVHEPGADTGPAAVTVDDAWFPADQQWVGRRLGAPSVLDEDLGLEYCIRAGLPPERCLGIARHGEFVNPDHGEESALVRTFVTGVHVFHPNGAGGEALAAMAAEAPLNLPPTTHPGAHTEVLNVGEVVRAVHPRPQDPVPVPSPFPYLPAHPQELLRMYLEVVGVRAADCYSAQVTVDSYRELSGRILDEGSTNMGPKQPCADGKARGRIHGAEHVVVTYRDSPAYAEGRTRWAAYQQEVLLAHLERQTHVRRPVEDHDGTYADHALIRAGATLLRGAERIASIGERRPPPPYRYCWPPVT